MASFPDICRFGIGGAGGAVPSARFPIELCTEIGLKAAGTRNATRASKLNQILLFLNMLFLL